MEKQLTVRQCSVIMFVLIIANKLMMLPSIISFQSANDTWLSFLLSFVVDFVLAIGIVAVICKLDEDIFKFLQRKIGKVCTSLIMFVASLIFTLKIVDIIFETLTMLNEYIYVDFGFLLFFFIILLVIVYFGTREFRSLGRTVEILFTTICGALVISFLISIGTSDFSNILPIMQTGASRIAQNSFYHIFWYCDSFVMLFFAGNVKKEKQMSKKLILSYLATILTALLFVVIFTSVFANTAPMHRTCILDIGENLPRLLTEGRFNWIVYFIFPITPIFAIAIYSYLALNCISYDIEKIVVHKKIVSSVLICINIIVILLLFNGLWNNFYAFASSVMPYVCLVFQVFLPIILIVAVFVSTQKKGNLNAQNPAFLQQSNVPKQSEKSSQQNNATAKKSFSLNNVSNSQNDKQSQNRAFGQQTNSSKQKNVLQNETQSQQKRLSTQKRGGRIWKKR